MRSIHAMEILLRQLSTFDLSKYRIWPMQLWNSSSVDVSIPHPFRDFPLFLFYTFLLLSLSQMLLPILFSLHRTQEPLYGFQDAPPQQTSTWIQFAELLLQWATLCRQYIRFFISNLRLDTSPTTKIVQKSLQFLVLPFYEQTWAVVSNFSEFWVASHTGGMPPPPIICCVEPPHTIITCLPHYTPITCFTSTAGASPPLVTDSVV